MSLNYKKGYMQKTVTCCDFSAKMQYHHALFFGNSHHHICTNWFPPIEPFVNIYTCTLLLCSVLWTYGFPAPPNTSLLLPLEKAWTFPVSLSQDKMVMVAILMHLLDNKYLENSGMTVLVLNFSSFLSFSHLESNLYILLS